MGLFSSKQKHTVGTQAQRLIDDELISDPAINGVLKTIMFGGDEPDLSGNMQDQLLNGSVQQFNKMFRYAERGEYTYGLPDVTVRSSDEGTQVAVDTLQAELGYDITAQYVYYRPLNNVHVGWQTLTDSYGYQASTNEIVLLRDSKPNPVYLDFMVAVHSSKDGHDIEVPSLGSFEPSASAGVTPERNEWLSGISRQDLVSTMGVRTGADETESVEIHYVWLDENGAVAKDMFVIDLSSYDTDLEYYHIKYDTPTATNQYWTHDPTTSANTVLRTLFDPVVALPGSEEGTYFPFAVLRSEGIDRTTEDLQETDEYITTNKLLGYLGIDIGELGEALSEGADLNQVKQSVIMMGVPISTTDEVEITYLHEYFSNLYDRLPTAGKTLLEPDAKPDLNSQFGLSGGRRANYAAQISDADFELNISFDYIERRLVPGSIGPVGTVTNGLQLATPSNPHATSTSSSVFGLANELNRVLGGLSPNGNRIITRQIIAGVYEEILIGNPKVRYRVVGELFVEGGVGEGSIALIPIDRAVAKKMGTHKLNELYQRSLHMVFNSYVITTIKWYERGLAAAIISIIITVIAIYFQQPQLFAAAWAAGAAAFAIFIFTQFLISNIISLAVKVVFTLVAEAVGVEAAAWIAVVVAVVAGYQTVSSGGTITASASTLLTVTNGLIVGTMAALEKDFRELMDEMNDWQMWADAETEELRQIQRELDSNIGIDPFAFVGFTPMGALPGETSRQYYNRHTNTDTCARALDITQHFCERSTTLPTLTETLEGFA